MSRKKEKRKKKHTLRRILLGITLIILSGVLYICVKVCDLDAWHEFDAQKILDAGESLIIYDSDMQEICTLYNSQNRISIPLSQVPTHVQKAFISAEDARFYEHIGIDVIRIAGAAIADIKSGGYVQGASTITQQLIKLSHLSPNKTMQRKAEEAVLAYIMESKFTKDEILQMYLNYIYFGGGFYGIEAASRGYFGVSANELSVAQGATLAGILKSPSKYAPHLNYEASMGRRDVVLSLMHEYGYLSNSEYEEALSQDIVLNMQDAPQRSYFIDYAISQSCEILDIDSEELLNGGYRIYTSLDSKLQSKCDAIYADNRYFPSEDVQSALTVIDNETGYIKAMIGGRNQEYSANSYNRAVQIRRQPGSVIKPIIVYAPAIEYYGYTAATVIEDEPKSFGNYTPKNSGNKYYGNVTLRRAISGSLNIPAVTVLDDIGVENGKKFAQKLGIEFDSKDESLSLALGGFTYGVSPLQIAEAYAALKDGLYCDASAIICITDKNGNNLYTHNIKKSRVMSAQNAFILTDMLCSVAKEGTGRKLSDLDFDVACKTGTVSQSDKSNRDAWMAAYTNDYSVVVWMGYDSANDGSMESSVTGGSYPAVIVHEVLDYVHKTQKPQFSMPNGIVRIKLDKHSVESDSVAALATPFTPTASVFYEYFVTGTQPNQESVYWDMPAPPDDFVCVSCTDTTVTFNFTIKNDNALYMLYRQDAQNNIVCVGEFTGQTGEKITCQDTDFPPNALLQYYIVPVHKDLEFGGEKIHGPKSLPITIVTAGEKKTGTDG